MSYKSWVTIFTLPHITYFQTKNSRPNTSALRTYETTLITILKQAFYETKNEKVYICIIILKLNAGKCGPEKTPYLNTFHAVQVVNKSVLEKGIFKTTEAATGAVLEKGCS